MKNTTENNKLLAEFLQFKRYSIKGKNDGYIVQFREGQIPVNTCGANLIFHSDWNWLMQIVEKIESLGYWVQIKRNHCFIENFGNSYEAKQNNTFFINQVQWGKNKLHATYNACTEFVKYYNENSAKEN